LPHEAAEKLLNRLSLREFVVEFLGSFIPGLIFVTFSLAAVALPVLLLHETIPHLYLTHDEVHYDANLIDEILTMASAYKVMFVIFVLALGFVFGHIAMSQSLDYPDEKSWQYIFIRLHPDERSRWAARNRDEALFPYANLKDFLKWKQLDRLAQHIPWTPNPDFKLADDSAGVVETEIARVKKFVDAILPMQFRFLPKKRTNLYAACNKELFNILKLRIRLAVPAAYSDLTHAEANIRLSGTSFYMCRLIRSLCIYMLALSLGIALLPYWVGSESFPACFKSVPLIDALVFYIMAIIISWQSIRLILKSLHKQRLREVVLVFAIASQCPEVLKDFPTIQ